MDSGNPEQVVNESDSEDNGYGSDASISSEALETMPEPTEAHKFVESFTSHLHQFKQELYKEIVVSNNQENPFTIQYMRTFHALWLQSIAYFIGRVDSQPVEQPTQLPESTFLLFKKLDTMIQEAKERPDTRDTTTLLYSRLFQTQMEHPFQFMQNQTSE